MLKVLLTIDGSKSSERAVKHLIHWVKSSHPMDIHLLNVQPPIMSGEISLIATAKTVENLHHDKGEKTAESARALLDDAGIQYAFRIEFGPIAETIARYARNNHHGYAGDECDKQPYPRIGRNEGYPPRPRAGNVGKVIQSYLTREGVIAWNPTPSSGRCC